MNSVGEEKGSNFQPPCHYLLILQIFLLFFFFLAIAEKMQSNILNILIIAICSICKEQITKGIDLIKKN